MKTKLMLIAVLLSFGFSGFSQVSFKPGLGMTFTDYVNFDGAFAAAKVGTQLGGSVAIGKKVYIEPGVFYAVKSTEFTTSLGNTTSDSKVKGVRVPVALGFGVLGNEKSTFNLRVFGGGSGFFVTGTSGKISKDEVKSPSYGAFAGVGVDVWILYVDASYEWSLTDASQISNGKSRTGFITVGLKF